MISTMTPLASHASIHAKHRHYDVIIIGSGISGSFIAQDATKSGARVLMLEAGKDFNKHSYPRDEIDGNSQLYWNGGLETSTDASIAFLRPKVVGGGSIVNQALIDAFDDEALSSWHKQSGIDFFSTAAMQPWYEKAKSFFSLQEIPKQYWNRNAQIFADGFKANGFQCQPLKRAQKNCHFERGNDCIECLSGCPIDSKQSMPVTTLKLALERGLELISEFDVSTLSRQGNWFEVIGKNCLGERQGFTCDRVVMAAGAFGNTRILLQSGFGSKLPAIGHHFYNHAQFMTFALYKEKIRAHKGPLQSLKSADPNFRAQGFKLENVYAPPVSIAMLFKGYGHQHAAKMKQLEHMACIEVAIRDVTPGKIELDRNGKLLVEKPMAAEDLARRDRGLAAVHKIFKATGADDTIAGDLCFGLHLMGGCSIGRDRKSSVVNENFKIHGEERIYCADSSIFPNAPGINPSFTIMAMALQAAQQLNSDMQRGA